MLKVNSITVTPFEQNARVLSKPDTGKVVLIDPGGDVERFLEEGKGVEAILLTHSHIDHCGGVARVLRLLSEWGQPTPMLYAGAERELRESIEMQAAYFGIPPGRAENCPEPDVLLQPGMTIPVLGHEFEARFTPGHSPGHFSFITPELSFELNELGQRVSGSGRLCFAGDTLFRGSIGRTDLPGGDSKQLLQSIERELMTLPGETLVLSGHGPFTTVERERNTNPFLLMR